MCALCIITLWLISQSARLPSTPRYRKNWVYAVRGGTSNHDKARHVGTSKNKSWQWLKTQMLKIFAPTYIQISFWKRRVYHSVLTALYKVRATLRPHFSTVLASPKFMEAHTSIVGIHPVQYSHTSFWVHRKHTMQVRETYPAPH